MFSDYSSNFSGCKRLPGKGKLSAEDGEYILSIVSLFKRKAKPADRFERLVRPSIDCSQLAVTKSSRIQGPEMSVADVGGEGVGVGDGGGFSVDIKAYIICLVHGVVVRSLLNVAASGFSKMTALSMRLCPISVG